MKKLILSTGNRDKLKELRDLLAELPYEVLSKEEAGYADLDVEEDGATLAENAEKKARALHERCGEAVVADDTGLFVDALNGAPGIHAARYAGEHVTYADNRKKMLEELKEASTRRAEFRTCVCLIEEDGTAHYVEGVCPGTVAEEERGETGFGYDSIFVPEGGNRTFAEMTEEEKNRISHRGIAMRKLLSLLEELR
jgi:non-canonical purine NTP pyrophosphatase (RdgB/HAM1 family)